MSKHRCAIEGVTETIADLAAPDGLAGGIKPAILANLLRDIAGNPFRPGSSPWRWIDTTTVAGPSSRIRYTAEAPWLTPTVVSLATAAYEERGQDGTLDPVRLAVLADALLDAGCDNEEMLRHLRGWEVCPRCQGTGAKWKSLGRDLSPCDCVRTSGYGWVQRFNPHVRGCWVIDLLLGKE